MPYKPGSTICIRKASLRPWMYPSSSGPSMGEENMESLLRHFEIALVLYTHYKETLQTMKEQPLQPTVSTTAPGGTSSVCLQSQACTGVFSSCKICTASVQMAQSFLKPPRCRTSTSIQAAAYVASWLHMSDPYRGLSNVTAVACPRLALKNLRVPRHGICSSLTLI